MDPGAFAAATLFKWDLRGKAFQPNRVQLIEPAALRELVLGMEDMLGAYGVRYCTAARIAELGFTVHTLLFMKDEELDDMMNMVSHYFRVDLLVGEKYGIKAAVRSGRRRLEESEELDLALSGDTDVMGAFSQQGMSEEPVQQEKEKVGSRGGAGSKAAAAAERRKLRKARRGGGGGHKRNCTQEFDEVNQDTTGGATRALMTREHPFIVTLTGEVARGKKNGLDYLFHLYEQCRNFLAQVQNIAKERGEKCPVKVTNQVFRFARKEGANYINKPKMRHYLHCYALHLLDEEGSNALRRQYKLRGDNIGVWRQACYRPIVEIAAGQGWDIDAIFNAHPLLCVWYVPTKLRKLCHAERSNATASSSTSGGNGTVFQLP